MNKEKDLPDFIVAEFDNPTNRKRLVLLQHDLVKITKKLNNYAKLLSKAIMEKKENKKITKSTKNNVYYINPQLNNLLNIIESQLDQFEDFNSYLLILNQVIVEFDKTFKGNQKHLVHSKAMLDHTKELFNNILVKTRAANVLNFYNEKFNE